MLKIKTAEGGVVMATILVCMKTFYVKFRTGEVRLIVSKTYIIPSLKSDLLSVKILNCQGYRFINDADPEDSGIFAVIDRKID
jgi:hypothetical protein